MSDPDKLKMLKKSRGGHRAYLTKLVKTSEELMDEGVKKEDDEEFFAIEADIITNKDIFKEKIKVLEGLDEAIGMVTDPDSLEYEIVEAEEYNRLVRKSIVVCERWLERRKRCYTCGSKEHIIKDCNKEQNSIH